MSERPGACERQADVIYSSPGRGRPGLRPAECPELPEDNFSEEQGTVAPLGGFHSITNRGLDRTWLEIPLLPPRPDYIYHHLLLQNLQASPVQIMNRGSQSTAEHLLRSSQCRPASGNTSFSRKAFICQQRDNAKTLKTNQTGGKKRWPLWLSAVSLIC